MLMTSSLPLETLVSCSSLSNLNYLQFSEHTILPSPEFLCEYFAPCPGRVSKHLLYMSFSLLNLTQPSDICCRVSSSGSADHRGQAGPSCPPVSRPSPPDDLHTCWWGGEHLGSIFLCSALCQHQPPSLVTLIIALPADPYAFPQHKGVGFSSAWFLGLSLSYAGCFLSTWLHQHCLSCTLLVC